MCISIRSVSYAYTWEDKFPKKFRKWQKSLSRKLATGNQHRGEARPVRSEITGKHTQGKFRVSPGKTFHKNSTVTRKKGRAITIKTGMDDDVRVWALLIFSLCCCLIKDMTTRLFRSSCCLRNTLTRAALVWRCVSYLRDRRAQYGSVQQGSAKSGLCTAITQVNYTRQPKWQIMVNNTKKGKFGISSRKIPKSRNCPPVQAAAYGHRDDPPFLFL